VNRLSALQPADLLKPLLYALLLLGIYYSTFQWLVVEDWARGDFNHSYFVPIVILYLIWEKRDRFAAQESVPTWKGLVPVTAGIFLFWLGELAGEFYSLYLSFWLVLIGLCWIHLGWAKLKTIIFPLAMLLVTFPPPHFLYDKISFQLRLMSSQLGVDMMRLFGMSAYREGNIIDLDFTQLQVVDACNGLRYLVPLIGLGLLAAYVYRAAWWKRALLVVSTIPVAIVTNGLRIALTGILYEHVGQEAAEGFFHGFSGWLIFVFCLLVLVVEMKVLGGSFSGNAKGKGQRAKGEGQRAGGKRQEASGKGRRAESKEQRVEGQGPRAKGEGEKIEAQSSKLKVESSKSSEDRNKRERENDIGEPASGKPANVFVGRLMRPPQALVSIAMLGLTLILSQGIDFRGDVPPLRPFNQWPLQLPPWEGERDSMEQQFIDELDLDDYTIIDYRNPEGKMVNFYAAYYASQTKGESIHSPATCLPGSGWAFKDAATVSVPTGFDRTPTITAQKAVIQKLDARQLVYYWFQQRGRQVTSTYQLKWYAFWDALTKRRTDGALVRMITPIYDSETVAQAEQRLTGFLKDVAPTLTQFIPGRDVSGWKENLRHENGQSQ